MKTLSEVQNSEPQNTFSWALGKMPVITMVSVTVSVTVSVKTSAKREGSVTVSVEVPAKPVFGGNRPWGAARLLRCMEKRCFACCGDHRQSCCAVVTWRRCAAGSCTFGHAKCAPLDAQAVQVRTLELRTLGRTNCAHLDAPIVHIRTPDV